jgi:ankyrin repeat protein
MSGMEIFRNPLFQQRAGNLAQFPALPNELLYMIADNLSEQDLDRLIRTCKQMHALFNGYLYKLTVKNRGNTTLFWACVRGQPKVAQRMLDLGVSAESSCSNMVFASSRPVMAMETPLTSAIFYNHPACVKVLLEHGVNINSQASLGRSVNPLEQAAREGRLDIVRILIEKGADVNLTGGARRFTPLHSAVSFACFRDHQPPENVIKPIVRLLLDHGANPNAKDEDQSTPLHLTTNMSVAELLIQHKAEVNIANRHDLTPLSIAVRARDNGWVRMLLSNPYQKADPNIPNFRGETALFFVGAGGQHYRPGVHMKNPPDADAKIAETLIEFGANVHHLDKQLRTALFQICEVGDTDTVKLLLEHGCSPSMKNKKGLTPIHIAAEEGWPAICELLIKAGANVNAINYYRSTPLHRLTSIPKRRFRPPGHPERYAETIKMLLKYGANINAVDRISQTPLMKSAYHGYWKFVDPLMKDANVDLLIKDRRGKMAMELSKDCGFESRELIRLTQEAEEKKVKEEVKEEVKHEVKAEVKYEDS